MTHLTRAFIAAGLAWRRKALQRWIYRKLIPLGTTWFIRLRWPWPLRKPWQRKTLRVFCHGGGIGDEMMGIAVLHAIKKRNPRCRITFVCRHPGLFEGMDCIDTIESYAPPQKPTGTALAYGHILPPPRPLITLMAECVGLSLHDAQTEAPTFAGIAAAALKTQQPGLPRIVIQPLASQWTPNKSWPTQNWIELIDLLTTRFEVIEVGTQSELPAGQLGPRFISLVGQTRLEDMVRLIGEADFFIGPPSGGMHLAHACGVPSVILFGGYESPAGHNYPRMTAFYTPVPCAPCWLDSQCPFERKCLTAIRPVAVFEAVCRGFDRLGKRAADAFPLEGDAPASPGLA